MVCWVGLKRQSCQRIRLDFGLAVLGKANRGDPLIEVDDSVIMYAADDGAYTREADAREEMDLGFLVGSLMRSKGSMTNGGALD